MRLHIRLQPVVVCCLISISTAATCQPRPLRVPVEDVVLSNTAGIRGAAVAVGTPPQNLSFTMSNVRNETYVYGTNGLCPDDHTDLWCQSWRGGFYDSKNSSTAANEPEDYAEGDVFTDILSGPNGTSLGEVQFGVATKPLDDPYESQAQLGLGLSSSLLNTLKNAGKIGSRSYSVYQGREGSSKAQGSLVLGGVDQALIGAGKNYTANLIYYPDCTSGMKVPFDDLVLNFPNGTDASLFNDSSTAMQACLQPSFPGLMTMPVDLWKRFRELAGGVSPDGDKEKRAYEFGFRTIVEEADSAYDGDFTLSIQNGIPIKIPNSELVVPWTDINDDTGLRTEVNSSLANLIINPLDYEWGDGGHLPIMGRLFFSTAYLSVNHDAGTFTIWSAEDSFSSGTPSIKALSPENAIVEDFCDGTGNDESPIQESPGSTDTPSPQQEQKSKLSGGAIGGIVLGGLAFVAAILALILFLLRKKKAKAKPDEGDVDEARDPPLPPYHSRPYFDVPSEMPASAVAAAAAPQTTKYAYRELDGHSQPQELDATYGRAI